MNTTLSVRLNLSREHLGPPLALKNLSHTDGHFFRHGVWNVRWLHFSSANFSGHPVPKGPCKHTDWPCWGQCQLHRHRLLPLPADQRQQGDPVGSETCFLLSTGTFPGLAVGVFYFWFILSLRPKLSGYTLYVYD